MVNAENFWSKLGKAFQNLKVEAEFRGLTFHTREDGTVYVGLSYILVPLEKSTFKPILFAGYTAPGSGKNNKRLDARTSSYEEKIQKETGFRTSINKYSIEVNPSKVESFRIMADISVPFSTIESV